MELSGRVKNIIFKNTENGFTVFVLKMMMGILYVMVHLKI